MVPLTAGVAGGHDRRFDGLAGAAISLAEHTAVVADVGYRRSRQPGKTAAGGGPPTDFHRAGRRGLTIRFYRWQRYSPL